MNQLWRRLALVLALILIGSFVLAACGDDDDDEATATAPAATSTSGGTGGASPTTAATTAASTNTTGSTAGASPTTAEATPTEAAEPTATESAEEPTATEGGDEEFSGAINIDGSSTVFPISQAAAEEFNTMHGDVEITVGLSGTGGGFEKFCAGDTDISNASRPIKEEEAANCAAAGIEFTELQVAIDGLSVVVNPENDFVDCLTVEQLNMIWKPDSPAQNWSDVDPSWPDEKIDLYGPGTDSGTFDYFTEVINGEVDASRADYTASEDDNVLVQGVAGSEYALGYFGLAYYIENQDSLRIVQVDGGDGCVEPTEETVADGSYAPLSRPLFIYVNNAVLAEKPAVAAFAEYMLSDDLQEIIPEVGYVDMDEATLEEQRAALEAAMGS